MADQKQSSDLSKKSSWARLEPPQVDGEAPPHCLLWGRFWATMDNLAAAFYIDINTEKQRVNTFRLAIFSDFARLDEYNPRHSPQRFEDMLLSYNISDVPVPKVTLTEIKTQFKSEITSAGEIDKLYKLLNNKNSEGFESWAKTFFQKFVDKGEVEYHVRGWLTDPKNLKESSEELENVDPSSDEITKVQVIYINSPLGGKLPTELEVGDEVHVRIVGSAVEKLPDYMRDDSNEKRSVPVKSWVHSIEDNPDLPPQFDGESKNYFRITTELEAGVFGEGLVFKDERLKTNDSGIDLDLKPEDVYPLLILIIFLLVILLLLILG